MKEEIIQLSREFAILSRETSFVAVEKRVGEEKTTGEAVLRKIPVMLTKGWGGVQMDLSSGIAAPTIMGKLAAPLFSIKAVSRDRDSLMEPADGYRLSEDSPLFFNKESFEPPRTSEDILMQILSLQRAEGGFEINRDISQKIGITIGELKKLSKKIKAIKKTDMLILLSTAIILQLLKKYYSDREDEWKELVGKSELWFKSEISRTEPRIDGIRLEDWIAQFIRSQKFQDIFESA